MYSSRWLEDKQRELLYLVLALHVIYARVLCVGPADVDEPDRVDLRVDARPGAPRQAGREPGADQVRAGGGARVRGHGGGGPDDQGPRHLHLRQQVRRPVPPSSRLLSHALLAQLRIYYIDNY